MNKQKEIIMLIDMLSAIYNLEPNDKRVLFDKFNTLSKKEYSKVVVAISDFFDNLNNSLNQFQTKIQKTSFELEEIDEQQELLKQNVNILNNI